MASENAQGSQQQTTRPLSKGPRKRAGGNNGNGKRFPTGQNSHTGEVFRRGPDHIARGSVKLLYSQILLDEREELYRQTVRGIRGDPRYAMEFLERAADRIEGRPKQTIVASVSRTTVFGPDREGAEPQPIREGASAPAKDPVQRVVDEAIATRSTLLGLEVESVREPETPAPPARR